MKKLDDKIISTDEGLKFKENKEMDISCDCCSSETLPNSNCMYFIYFLIMLIEKLLTI